jgi:predicted negative regulator of RcsB-dependent stress response
MAYDLEEQEQLDAIKGWWNDNGKLVILALVAVVVGLAAFQGWRYYRAQQSERAAALFQQLEGAERANDPKRVREIAAQVRDKQGSTQYAALAALSAAKASVSTGEIEDAKRNLEWVVERAKDEDLKDVARLRLAGVLLDEKKYDDALKVLSVKTGEAYAGLYADLRGDVLAAAGKPAEARAAYRAALDKSDPNSTYRRLIEIKLDALGEAK